MTPDELDRILSTGADIVPSPGFVGAVMEAVKREASTPPPIPFPWKRALPGIVAWGSALIWAVVASLGQSWQGVPTRSPLPGLATTLSLALQTTDVTVAVWVVVSLSLAFTCLRLSMHLTGKTV